MYNSYEGKRDLFVKELSAVIIMFLSTAALAFFVWGTVSRYGVNTAYCAIYLLWFALSVYFTKAYLFLTPRKRYGTVTAIKDFKEAWYRPNKGDGGYFMYKGHSITQCTITVAFDGGKEGDFVFVYKGDIKILKLGDRVGIFRFLKMPVWETDPV